MRKLSEDVRQNVIDLRVDKRLSLWDIHKITGISKTTCARVLKEYPLTKDEKKEIHRNKVKGKPKNYVGINLIGERFGRLLVTKKVLTDKRHTRWECVCDCGNTIITRTCTLKEGTTSSCGCFARDEARKRLCVDPYTVNFNRLFMSYKNSARKREIDFELSSDEFKLLVKGDCYYCGCSPNRESHLHARWEGSGREESVFFNGVDRVDNNRGYEKNNCVSCCKMCNYAKRTSSQEEFLRWIEKVVNYQKSKEICHEKSG